MIFKRHAAPPPGEWINDPNGLVFRNGLWHLFVQHSAAPPDYKAIGWGLLTSADLICWEWQGQVIPADTLGQAYSGSVVSEGKMLAAYLTRADSEVQRQVRLASRDGRTWTQGSPLGPEGRNVRDPFVFFCRATSDWRMLLAEPCDWREWESDPPSRLSVWRRAGEQWLFVSHIGPWSPPGVMWEVPVLVDFGDKQALILSLVDRRGDGVRCSVRGWIGGFDGVDFAPDKADGQLLDLGPDFYAAIVQAGGVTHPLLVAWASSWATARAMPWPGGVNGGPITLPRRLTLGPGGQLQQELAAEADPILTLAYDGCTPLALELAGDDCRLDLHVGPQGIGLQRSGSALLDWQQYETVALVEPQSIAIHEDAGLIEILIQPAGLTATIFLPGARL